MTIESNGNYITDESLNLIAGKTYYVTFDNNTYEYIAKSGIQGDAFRTYIGNGIMLDNHNEGNGEPFVFYSDPIYKRGIRLDVETFGTHTIALSFDAENIKTIDPKYLPNGGQADWNQNDETAPDYVKNRTHYEYETYSVLWEGTNLSMSDAGFMSGYNGLQAGQTYIITFRDVVYECVAWEHTNGYVYAGNSAVIATPGIWGYDSTVDADSHNNGEPFCMRNDGYTGYTITPDYQSTNNNIKVEGLVLAYKTLDPKYLPNGGQSDWN